MAQGAAGKGRNAMMAGPGLGRAVHKVARRGGEKSVKYSMARVREELLASVWELERSIAGLSAEDMPGGWVYVEAKLRPEYLAMSYNPHRVFEYLGVTPVGSRSIFSTTWPSAEDDPAGKGESAAGGTGTDGGGAKGSRNESGQSGPRETKSIIFRMPVGRVPKLRRLVESIGSRDKSSLVDVILQLRHIDCFDLARCEVLERCVSDVGDQVLWEAVIHPVGRQAVSAHVPSDEVEFADKKLIPCSEETLSQFCKVVANRGGMVHSDYIRNCGGLTFVPFTASVAVMQSLVSFNPVRQMSRVADVVVPATVHQSNMLPASGFGESPEAALSTVAILGPGFDETAKGVPAAWKLEKLSPAQPSNGDVDAGTAMAFLVSHGYCTSLANLRPNPVAVTSYRVFPAPDTVAVPSYWVLDRIEEAVKRHVEAEGNPSPVLMLGVVLAAEADQLGRPSLWSARLDELALNHGVVFIVPVGDSDYLPGDDAGPGRLLCPADAVYAVSVGASAEPGQGKQSSRLAQREFVSSQRNAPDRGEEEEPTLIRAEYSRVGPGRSGAKVKPTISRFGGTKTDPVFSMVSCDRSVEGWGTGLSAAATMHDVVRATDSFSPEFRRPEVVRAVVVQCVSSPSKRYDGKGRFADVGFGEGGHLTERLIAQGNNEFSVMCSRELKGSQQWPVLVPVPKGYQHSVILEATVAMAAPVDPAEAADYTCASLALQLRPSKDWREYSNLDPQGEEPKTRKLTTQKAAAEGLSADKWRRGNKPAILHPTKVTSASEQGLRANGKWESVNKASYEMDSGKINEPELTVVCYTRRAGRSAAKKISVPVVLIMTIRGDEKDETFGSTIRSEHKELLASLVRD